MKRRRHGRTRATPAAAGHTRTYTTSSPHLSIDVIGHLIRASCIRVYVGTYKKKLGPLCSMSSDRTPDYRRLLTMAQPAISDRRRSPTIRRRCSRGTRTVDRGAPRHARTAITTKHELALQVRRIGGSTATYVWPMRGDRWKHRPSRVIPRILRVV